jgi:hypothetical protein
LGASFGRESLPFTEQFNRPMKHQSHRLIKISLTDRTPNSLSKGHKFHC